MHYHDGKFIEHIYIFQNPVWQKVPNDSKEAQDGGEGWRSQKSYGMKTFKALRNMSCSSQVRHIIKFPRASVFNPPKRRSRARENMERSAVLCSFSFCANDAGSLLINALGAPSEGDPPYPRYATEETSAATAEGDLRRGEGDPSQRGRGRARAAESAADHYSQ